MTPSYHRSISKIDHLLKKFRDPQYDDYAQSHIANYICVLLSGLLETAVREIFADYCERCSAPTVANFVKSRLERFQNPDPESILQLIAAFNQKWADDLDAFWSGEVKDAVGSIVGNRHLIAHGRDTTLTLYRVSEWFQAGKKLIDFISKLYG